MLLATAGAAYIVAGAVYRVPMSVQPLKSVVVAALALGASAAEIHMSGLLVGLCCLALSFFYADRLATVVPRHLVQGLQLGLGVILMVKGMKWGMEGVNEPWLAAGIFFLLALGMIGATFRTALPVMGWVATGGLFMALAMAFTGQSAPTVSQDQNLRFDIILALVLPQLALTLTNSVVGTHDAARRYFGDRAARVKPSWLLRTIGGGNIISAGLGGLPFCHGSGGLTAHVKGGATGWHMNLIIGGTLLAFALFSWLFGMALIPAYPVMLMAVLLFVTGFFHMQLAAPSWARPELRWILLSMALTALLTQNMLWTLGIGIACEIMRFLRGNQKRKMVQ